MPRSRIKIDSSSKYVPCGHCHPGTSEKGNPVVYVRFLKTFWTLSSNEKYWKKKGPDGRINNVRYHIWKNNRQCGLGFVGHHDDKPLLVFRVQKGRSKKLRDAYFVFDVTEDGQINDNATIYFDPSNEILDELEPQREWS